MTWCHVHYDKKNHFFLSVAKYGSAWHVAQTQIISSYRAFSREKVVAELGAYIGLGHVNVTLRGKFTCGLGCDNNMHWDRASAQIQYIVLYLHTRYEGCDVKI